MSYFYETDSDEEKKPRKLNKKNCGKPPKKMIIIKNTNDTFTVYTMFLSWSWI